MKRLSIKKILCFVFVLSMFACSVFAIKAAAQDEMDLRMPSYISGSITATQSWKSFGDIEKVNSNSNMSVRNKSGVGVIAYYLFRPEAKLGGSFIAVGNTYSIYKDNVVHSVNADTTIDSGIRVRVGYTLDSSATSVTSDSGYIDFYYN